MQLSVLVVICIVVGLEELVGVWLLVCIMCLVKIIEVGVCYLEDCCCIFVEIVEVEVVVVGYYDQFLGMLLVMVVLLFGQLYVLFIVIEYFDFYLGMWVWIFFVDCLVNIVEEGMDVVVCIGYLLDLGFMVIQVGLVSCVICVLFDYLCQYGMLVVFVDFKQYCIVMFISVWVLLEWCFVDGQCVVVDVVLQININEVVISIVCQGWGLMCVLVYQVVVDLQVGCLQWVMCEFEELLLLIYVFYLEGWCLLVKVWVFIDLVVSCLWVYFVFY